MRQFTNILYKFVIVVILILSFGINNVAYGEPGGVIYVSGSITADTTWNSGDTVIISGHTTVSNGAVLTIEPGVKVKFVNYRGYKDLDKRLRLVVVGASIIAEGTALQPIYFTSDASVPQNGDYDSVIVTDSSMTSSFKYCIFEFGITGLQVGNAQVSIENSVARWNNEAAIGLGPGSETNLSYCQIYQNGGNGINIHMVDSVNIDHCEIRNEGNFGIHALGSSVYVHESILHDNTGPGLMASLDADVTAFGLEIYNHADCAINNDHSTLEYGNLYLHNNGMDFCGGGTSTLVTTPITPPGSIDIGFIPDMSYALGYTPGDPTLDRFPYVFDKVDETRVVVDSIGESLGPTFSLAWDGTYLWTSPGLARIYKLDPDTGSILENFLPIESVEYGLPVTLGGGMTWDDEAFLWAMDTVQSKVYKIDPSSHTVQFSFSSPSASSYGLEWDGEYLSILDAASSLSIIQVDKTGAIINTHVLSSGLFGGLTWDGEHYWVPDNYRIYKYNQNGYLVGWIYAPGFRVNDMAWDGEYLWATATTLTARTDDKIFKIQIVDDHERATFIPLVVKP